MNDAEFLHCLDLPLEPRTSAELLCHLRTSGTCHVERVLGSAGEFVVEVTYLPACCRGCILCHPIGDDLFTIRGAHISDAPRSGPSVQAPTSACSLTIEACPDHVGPST
jgi:hypothetical protein